MDEEVVGGSNPVLSSQQRQVLYRVQEGASVFFTGPAGSGKSVLLRAIIENLKKKYSAEDFNDYVAVTAPTGIAALNIGGRTIHSWAGIGRGQEGVDVLERKTRGRWAKWRAARALIIDEISMLDGTLFDKLVWDLRR